MSHELTIRGTRGPQEYPRLVDIWRRSVTATDDFLVEEDRAAIESVLASDYFPAVDLHVAVDGATPVGFAGVAGGNLEMLFVDAPRRGEGIGYRLLAFAVEELGVRKVDVNEKNHQAVGFYRRQGFAVTSRSELDDQGRQYPILHMAL